MKKVLLIMLTLASTLVWAANEITIVPAADVHNGAAVGDAAGFIYTTGNVGKLDVSGMSKGDMLVFDVIMSDLNFTLAGYEFRIDYPVNLALLSITDADWENGWTNNAAPSSATYQPAGITATGPVQFLPANADGTRNSVTVENNSGIFRVGMLWTDAASRPVAYAGGQVIGRIAFEWKGGDTTDPLAGIVTCTSYGETIRVFLTPADPSTVPDADIFANDSAVRVSPDNASSTVAVSFGDETMTVRSDASRNLVRDTQDLMPSVRCCFFGKSDPVCNQFFDWANEDPLVFLQTFDYNCDGLADAGDLLPNAKLCFGTSNRTTFKNAEIYKISSKTGTLSVGYDKLVGGMSFIVLDYKDVQFDAPQISTEAQKAGWMLIYDLGPEALTYAVFNPNLTNVTFPDVTISYSAGQSAQLSVANFLTQGLNLSDLEIAPEIQDNSFVKAPVKDLDIKKVINK